MEIIALSVKKRQKKTSFINYKRGFEFLQKYYFFDSSIETFLNSFKSFSISKVDLRALGPAALTPFSVNDSASALNVSISALIFNNRSFMLILIKLGHKNRSLIDSYNKKAVKFINVFGFLFYNKLT